MKPIFRTKRRPQNRETAWPGRFKGPILEPRFPQPRGQNVTSGSTKKLYGCVQNAPLKTRKQHETAWPGRFKGPILEPRFPQPRGQNVTSGSTKKLYGCRQALQISLQGSRDPFWNHVSPSPGGKTSRLDPLKNYTVVVKL